VGIIQISLEDDLYYVTRNRKARVRVRGLKTKEAYEWK